MLRPSSATPCPIPTKYHNPRDSLLSANGDDTTANIDFTSAFPRPGTGLKNAKPRRPQKASATAFAIHEDDEPRSDAVDLMKAVRRNGGVSAIAQPPQRPKRAVNSAASTSIAATSTVVAADQPGIASNAGTSKRLSQAPRRPAIKTGAESVVVAPLPSLPEDPITLPSMDTTTMLKPARRGTLYIPSDDTTMPSMYMGLFSPIKNLDAAKIASAEGWGSGELNVEVTGIAAQMLAKKQRNARKSMIASSPKRGPLQVSARNLQEGNTVEDRWGQGTGKENVPPGQSETVDKKSKSPKRGAVFDAKSTYPEPARHQNPQPSIETRVSKLYGSTASSKARVNDKAVKSAGTKPTWNAGSRVKTSQPMPVWTTPSDHISNIAKASEPEVKFGESTIPSRFVIPRVSAQRIRDIYPVLEEDLANLSLYEDTWLNHQEVAMTQLINSLFGASAPVQSPVETEMLRIRLLERYNTPESAMLHKRLQAALLYGALGLPSGTLKGAAGLSTDLGRRKDFTDLWLDTYDLPCLKSALEVVVGRQCPNPSRTSSSSQSNSDGHGISRRALQAFIETFLIRNEDGTPDPSSRDRVAWACQRTLLRSMMLINLLDGTKALPRRLMNTCLFQPTSEYKSSADIIRALFQLLNPSAGDPFRALNYLGYVVTHAQYPLEEYSYKIENIAVDLRDGVCLTRMVELLLYPSASASLEYEHDVDLTTTVLLPTGDLLSLIDGEREWPLSQHLKLPCYGRATKLYNVQVGLSALQGVKGMAPLVHDIKAEDVVDGFREKTVKLVWAVTSRWGLSNLVDWDDLRREIKRLCRAGNNSHNNDFFDMTEDEEECTRHQVLLKSWAQAIASRRGIVVKNLTTSFADGRVFEAIVDECQGYLASDTQSTARRPLCERLRKLGCSEQFALLFSASQAPPNRPHLFDRDFVLTALAFLCSRLLGPTKGVRAAVTIQKAWRLHRGRVIDSRKVQLRGVAENCAQTVQNRKKIDGENNCGLRLPDDSADGHGHEAGLGSNKDGTASSTVTEVEDIWLDL